jgi:transposase-like protein
MKCHCCGGEEFKRNGKFSNRNRIVQRYQCLRCGGTYSESQPLDGVRIESDKAAMVVNMLAEGVGIRAIARLAELNKKTVLRILETAGRHCEQIMEEKVRGLHVNEIEIDEAYAFVGCLQQNTKGPHDMERGEQYAFLAIDPQTKLILRVTPVRLCDRFAPRRLGSATTKCSGDSNEIEPVILVGY